MELQLQQGTLMIPVSRICTKEVVRQQRKQKLNQSDPDLYPETQRNILAMGLIPNCKSDLYQFYHNSPKTCHSYRFDTDMCVLIWYSPDAAAVMIQFQ